jgi:hypothetical protein
MKRFKEKTKGKSAEGNFRMATHLDIGLDAAAKTNPLVA